MGRYWVKWKSGEHYSDKWNSYIPVYTKDGPFESELEAMYYLERNTTNNRPEIIWD